MSTFLNLNNLQIVGLIVDFIGAIILYKYGIASMIETGGKAVLCGASDTDTTKEEAKFKKWSKCGVLLLCAGFALQLIGQVLPMIIKQFI